MKVIGFIKENDKNVVKEKYLDGSSEYSNVTFINEKERNEIIKYLNSADKIFSITLALFIDENYIGPYSILSDGEWIWPSYFSYNLIKMEYVNSNFLAHLKQKNYKIVPLNKEQKQEATFYLEKEMLNI